MPELPEVETVRRGLNQVTLNQPITGGDVLLQRTIAAPPSALAFLTGITGQSIVQWHRRGKYLLAELDSSGAAHSPAIPAYLGVHLRMTGQLLWVNQAEPLQKHTRVRLFFGEQQELRFVDQRTFGQMWWIPPDRPLDSVMTGLRQLGPEPFSAEFSPPYLYQKLQTCRRPIKNALLDQSIVAGIGNIYADEALFLSGIHPQTLGTALTQNQVEQLRQSIVQVLQASIEVSGTTFSSFRTVDGVNGNYGGIAKVYARDGKTCLTCGTIIQRLRLAGRSAHFCPLCQLPNNAEDKQ